MDPNATLREINDADRYRRSREFCQYLASWLASGGFQPDWDAYPLGTKRFRRWQNEGSE